MSSTKSNLAYNFSVTFYYLIVNDIIFGLSKLERCFLGQNVKVLLPVKSIYMKYAHWGTCVYFLAIYICSWYRFSLYPYSGIGSSEVDNIFNLWWYMVIESGKIVSCNELHGSEKDLFSFFSFWNGKQLHTIINIIGCF